MSNVLSGSDNRLYWPFCVAPDAPPALLEQQPALPASAHTICQAKEKR